MPSWREPKRCAADLSDDPSTQHRLRRVIRCSFAAAWPQWQGVIELELEPSATVTMALRAARKLLAETSDELAGFLTDAAWEQGAVGIFGELCERERVLVEGDRVELYRPLQVDPKAARRHRAERLQSQKGRNPLTAKRPRRRSPAER